MTTGSLNVIIATFVSAAAASAASGSVGYGLDQGGRVSWFDSSDATQTALVVSAPISSADGLARDPASGTLWAINWSGNLYRINPSAGTWAFQGTVARPGGSGFYKDLAWDPVHNRLLATHLTSIAGTVNNIVEINTSAATHILLAQMNGFQGMSPQVLSLAVNAQGEASVWNLTDAYIYDLGPVPVTPVASIAAIRRSVRSFIPGIDMRGLEFDHATGQLYSSGQGLCEIASDGTATQLPGFVPYGFLDVTFIPSPAAGMLLMGGCACVGRTRVRS